MSFFKNQDGPASRVSEPQSGSEKQIATTSFSERLAEIHRSFPIELASLNHQPSTLNLSTGFVMDYEMVETCGYFTFQTGHTYLIDSYVVIDYATFESGSVTKFAYGQLAVTSYFTCPSSTPKAVLTDVNDDSVGFGFSESAHHFTGYHGAGLDLSQFGSLAYVHNLDIRFLSQGIYGPEIEGAGCFIYDCWFFKCEVGAFAGIPNSVYVYSSDFCQVTTPMSEYVAFNYYYDTYCTVDRNGNGLPDTWEMQYFASLSQSTSADYDGDGLSNLQEYQAGSSPVENDGLANPLALPPVGACYLRIISPTVLELVRITGGGDAAWDFGGNWPIASKFQVLVNGQSRTVQQTGFKRRPLYQSYPDTSDLRIDNDLYLVLATALNVNDSVEVIKAGTWSPLPLDWPNARFVAHNNPLRYGAAIHVNQEGYPIQVKEGGTLVAAPQTAIIGYYRGSLGQMNFSSIGSSAVHLVDAASGAVVSGFNPTVSDATDSGGVDSSQYQGLRRIDLGGFSQPGEYRLKVDGLGASFPFRIGDEVPMKFARTYALGLYHQRCGSASHDYAGGTALPITRITGTGSGATINPVIVNGSVTSGTIVNGGSGWNVGDMFTFTDSTGTGFIGTVATINAGALATFTINQLNDMPFTRFVHDDCHTAPASIPTPSFGAAWDIIARYGNKANPYQSANKLTSSGTMLFQFQQSGTVDEKGGHHDAGDYSKYTDNSAQLIHTLIFAADNFPGVVEFDNLGIPESGDGIPDVLQEAKWEADFLLKMQDSDGGFYTLVYPWNREYEDFTVPSDYPQIVWPKTTSVTAAAIAALAEIGSSPAFKYYYPTKAAQYLTAAQNGWNNFLAPAITPNKDAKFQTLYHYGDLWMHEDELAWAAAALFVATGNSSYDQKLRAWYPDPTANGPIPGESCGPIPNEDPDGTLAPCRAWKFGWWRMYEGYGCAVRDYAFFQQSGRYQQLIDAGQNPVINSQYLDYCNTAITDWGHKVRSWSQNNAYRTDLPQDHGWVPEFYFPDSWAFDMVVADQVDAGGEHDANTKAIVSSMNFEGGCNPNNVGFLPGLGWRRQRVVVNQYYWNAGYALPPDGNPIGCVNHLEDSGSSALRPYFYPPIGENTADFALYDRWADAKMDKSEFVAVQTARSLATAAWLAAQSSANLNQQWGIQQSGDAQITAGTIDFPNGNPALGQPATAQLTSSHDLSQARVVWDVEGAEPHIGSTVTVGRTTVGESRVEAEATLPDGRRVFGVSTAYVNDPAHGLSAYQPPYSDTVAMYHFDADFNDSSLPAYNLSDPNAGDPQRQVLFSDNTTWMANRQGKVARFRDSGDQLTGTVDGTVLMANSGDSMTIEAEIYPRAYKGSGDVSLLKITQGDGYYSYWSVAFNGNQGATSPEIVGPQGTVLVTQAEWAANVTPDTWHHIQITVGPDSGGTTETIVTIDDTFTKTLYPPAPHYEGTPWAITIGDFDGDVDEVRISSVVR